MLGPIKIGIADDNLLLRQGLVAMLKEKKDFQILFDVCNGKELLHNLKTKSPHIILLDVRMPVMNNQDAYTKIKEKYPLVKVVILSDHYNDTYISEFIINGAAGFLAKKCSFEKLTEAIYKVKKEGRYFDSIVSDALISKLIKNKHTITLSQQSLSERQIEIIKLMYDEKCPEEIASILFLSRRTVEWHKNQILEKTGTKTVVGMLKYALNNGILKL